MDGRGTRSCPAPAPSITRSFAGIASAALGVAALSARFLTLKRHAVVVTPARLHWQQVWANWDGSWYQAIARQGYTYTRGRQSSVAFFPAYPLLIHAGGLLVGHLVAVGVVVTLGSSLIAVLLLRTWLRERVSPEAASATLLLLLLYPYAFYLYGTLYADALFLACAIGAFVLLERGHPIWAGLVGTLATAARPVGVVLVVGLVLRAFELRSSSRLLAGDTRPGAEREARWWGLGVLISALGVVGYSSFLWWRFGDPLAFATAERGWHQSPGPATWLKIGFFEEITHAHSVGGMLIRVAHPLITFAALAMVPRVVRRFGWAYGAYVLLVIGLPAVSTKDFFGMARYGLAAFPCFAVVGEFLATRDSGRRIALASSGVLLALLTSLFARGYYLS